MNALALFLLAPLAAAPQDAEAPKDRDVKQAVNRAVELLLSSQENYIPDKPVGRVRESKFDAWQEGERKRLDELADPKTGSEWPYEGVYRVGPDGRIPPGYRIGGTSIVCLSLFDAPGYDKDRDRKDAIARAMVFVLDTLENDPGMVAGPKKGYDVRGWGHAYALRFLLRAKELGHIKKDQTERVEAMIPHLLGCLAANENPGGGWNYANNNSSSPFMTPSTLIALYEAKDQGYSFDPQLVERALASLERGRASETGSYSYSIGRRNRTEAMAASSARSAASELVLFQAGRSDSERLKMAIDGFFTNWDELFARKSKQGTHEGKYSIAPYYFFYGHTYAALAIEYLPKEERAKYRTMMRETLWRTLDEDGGWNDRIFPRTRSFSTAMSLMAIQAEDMPAIPEWKSAPSAGPSKKDSKKEEVKDGEL
jgi:hypothetical protein